MNITFFIKRRPNVYLKIPKVRAREDASAIPLLEDPGWIPSTRGGSQASVPLVLRYLILSSRLPSTKHQLWTHLHLSKIPIPMKIKQFWKHFFILKNIFLLQLHLYMEYTERHKDDYYLQLPWNFPFSQKQIDKLWCQYIKLNITTFKKTTGKF